MRAAWWWVDRWRKSTAYTDMTLAEQGAYRNLLDELWLRDGVLPNDERILGKVSGDALAWPEVKDKVLSYFELREDGWHNPTHDEIQAESQKRAERQKRYRNGQRNVTRNVAPSPSPSPSPSKDQSPKETDGTADAVLAVFEYWKKRTGRTEGVVLTPKRKACLKARLKEQPGETLEERVAALNMAVDGAILDPFYAGDNDKGKKYWDFESIFRNRDRVEKLQHVGRFREADPSLEPVEDAVPERAQDACELWRGIKTILSGTIPGQNFVTWFRPTEGHGWELDEASDTPVLVVAVPSQEHKRQIREVYGDRIKKLLSNRGVKLMRLAVQGP